MCFPNRTNKRLSGPFNVQALCHCLSSQIEKQMISNTWCFMFFFSLHSNPAVCSGLLIYFITGSCQGRALSAGRRAARRIPAEWVHAGLVCAEMPWISTVLRCRVRAKACNSSVSSLSLTFCFRTLHRVCMLRRGAVLRSQSHDGGAGGSGPVSDRCKLTCCEGPTAVSVSKWGFISRVTKFSLDSFNLIIGFTFKQTFRFKTVEWTFYNNPRAGE